MNEDVSHNHICWNCRSKYDCNRKDCVDFRINSKDCPYRVNDDYCQKEKVKDNTT